MTTHHPTQQSPSPFVDAQPFSWAPGGEATAGAPAAIMANAQPLSLETSSLLPALAGAPDQLVQQHISHHVSYQQPALAQRSAQPGAGYQELLVQHANAQLVQLSAAGSQSFAPIAQVPMHSMAPPHLRPSQGTMIGSMHMAPQPTRRNGVFSLALLMLVLAFGLSAAVAYEHGITPVKKTAAGNSAASTAAASTTAAAMTTAGAQGTAGPGAVTIPTPIHAGTPSTGRDASANVTPTSAPTSAPTPAPTSTNLAAKLPAPGGAGTPPSGPAAGVMPPA